MSIGEEKAAGAPASFGGREQGNILVLGLLLATLITTLATAQFFTTQKNARHSSYLNEKSRMRRFAESGMNQAVHEISFKVGRGDGNIGTENWVAGNDLGYDAKAGTNDEGEEDGIPSRGEPTLAPVRVGPTLDGIRMFTHTSDTEWSGVKHVTSTAYNGTALTTLEIYVQLTPVTIPGVGAVYIKPDTVVDLNGQAFTITGTDTDPDGTPGPASEVYGIVTDIGDPPGINSTEFYGQIDSKTADQVTGLGGDPSIGETNGIDFDAIYQAFRSAPKTTVATGTHSSVSWGNWMTDNYRVTYAPGDLHLTGTGSGAGVLVVDGSLTMSGSFTFVGIVIVRGDVSITGGGAGVHVYGSMLVGQTFTAVDHSNNDLKVTGTADLAFSSTAIAKASALLPMNSKILYWNDVK